MFRCKFDVIGHESCTGGNVPVLDLPGSVAGNQDVTRLALSHCRSEAHRRHGKRLRAQ